MKIENISMDAVAELLVFLAENEEFNSVKAVGSLSVREVKKILVQLAAQLKNQGDELAATRPDYQKLDLSPKALALLSSLSPREEMLLFKSFKLL